MNNRLIATAALLGIFACASAQTDALSLPSRAQMRRHGIENSSAGPAAANRMRKVSGRAADAQSTVAFLLLQEGTSTEDLAAEGMRVLTMRGDIAVVEVAYADVERCSRLPMMRSFQLQRDLKPHLDKAREATGVADIHAGLGGLSKAYTGAGVVAAVVDQGVDPNHISFCNPDGTSRIGFLSHLRYNAAGTGMAEDFYGHNVYEGGDLKKFKTDDNSTYHGTHTLNILGGGYKGEVEIATGMNGTTPEIVKVNNPYYGVATGAELAVSCGTLADGFIAYGMDHLYGYADYMGMPIVYSLSLGSNTGSHDPNSTIARFFDEVGKEAIICISAGNEGDLKIALNKTFTADDNSFRTLIHPYAYQYDPAGGDDFTNNTIRYGSIAVYSNDETPFDLQAIIYNKDRNYRVAKRMPVVGNGVGTYYCSSTDYQMDESDIVGDATFVRAFDGYVGVGGMIDEETGRYYGLVDYYIIDTEENRTTGTYVLGFEVTGSAGQRIDCYGDGLTTWMDNYGLDNFQDGSCNGSISDMAVAHNVIVVGSYNTRNKYTSLDGWESTYVGDGFVPGGVSGFSSFGTLADGRNLPTVCAPGSAIISAMSTPYLDAATASYNDANKIGYCNYINSARFTDANGRMHYWKQEIGTSMSTPFVAGCIALWLEADPTLTVDRVREIIQTTATVDDDVLGADPVRWGAGKFNALEGLKEVIRTADAGVNDVLAENSNDRLILTESARNVFDVFCADGSGRLSLQAFALSGSLVASVTADADQLTLDASAWAPGVYVVNVNGRHSTKICVK
ncbi:MAG: S8 family serine peptidase [Muribaculaceae bacterium]|nr:S8 family serine peptidase [Muribaculaceae bacterium]